MPLALADPPTDTKPRVDYVLAATLVASGLKLSEVAQRFGVKSESLRVGLYRKGIKQAVAAVTEQRIQRAEVIAQESLERASDKLRGTMAGILTKHSDKLAQVPAKPNLKHIRAVGDALEPLTRAAKTVFDWGNKVELGLIVAGEMTQAIDVEAEPAPADHKPEQLTAGNCGVDTPTGSSPAPDPAPANTTIDVKPDSIGT